MSSLLISGVQIGVSVRKHGLYLKDEIGYLNKWVPIAILIGIVAGTGAVVFAYAINEFTTLFLINGAGYTPPSPLGEGRRTSGRSSSPQPHEDGCP